MNIAIGAYRNPQDRDAKIAAYKKLLQAQINLGKLTEQAFKERSARGDALYVPTPLERPRYATQSEYLADLNEQENIAIQKTKELFPFGDDARKFVLDDLRPREMVLDPLAQPGSPSLPRVVLYNQYFDRFTQRRLKGISRLTPSSLLRAWSEFIDSLTEDLIPKQRVIDSIKGQVSRLLSMAKTQSDIKLGNDLLDVIDTELASEELLTRINNQLKRQFDFDSIRTILANYRPTGRSRAGLPPAPRIPPAPGAPPAPPVTPPAPPAPPAPSGVRRPRGKKPTALNM